MGDTYFHSYAIRMLMDALEDFFAGQRNVFIATNILFYYEQGNPLGRRDPDVLVAKGVRGNHPRRSYRLWEEGVLPCTLFEIASKKTWKTDLTEKRELYAALGVAEYFVFDPEGIFVNPVLRGFQLKRGRSVELKQAADGSLESKKLGLRLIPGGQVLQLADLKTGKHVLTRLEQTKEARNQAQQAQKRAAEMAAENARLRKMLEGRRSHTGGNGGR